MHRLANLGTLSLLSGQSLGGAVKSPTVVAAELGINTTHRGVAEGAGLLNTVAVSLLVLVVVGVVLGLGHW